jgi:serine/threonine protein kinase
VNHLRQVVDLPDLSGTRYELEREIGRGGMGTVYAAHDVDLDRRVALKVLDGKLFEEPRLMARLEHPSIVPVYERGVLPDGRVFYAMKLVSGMRFDRFIEGSPPLSERLRVIQRVGEALRFAHAQNMLHRDLKPQNVMVGEFGEVYVMDWGVEAVAGTPGFRAPEGAVDARSDVYALGALLDFAIWRDGGPAPLAAIAAKARFEGPEHRYQTTSDLLAEVARFQEGLAVQAYAESTWEVLRRHARRNAVLLWLLAAYLAARFLVFFLHGR